MGEPQAINGGAEVDTVTQPAGGARRSEGVAMPAALGVLVLLLVAACGALLWHHRSASVAQSERESYLRAASAGATNLATISHEHPEQDVRRVLDGSTGQFRDDFEQSAESYVAVVKQAQVSATAEEVDAGIESRGKGTATVLVQVTSKVTNRSGAPDQPRISRMLVTVDQVDDQYKVSKMEMVA